MLTDMIRPPCPLPLVYAPEGPLLGKGRTVRPEWEPMRGCWCCIGYAEGGGVGRVKVTLARSFAGSLLLEDGSHSTIPCSIGCHLPFPIALNPLALYPTHYIKKRLTCLGYPFGCTCSSHTSRPPFASHPSLRSEYDTLIRATFRQDHRTFDHTSK